MAGHQLGRGEGVQEIAAAWLGNGGEFHWVVEQGPVDPSGQVLLESVAGGLGVVF